jgi:hypothetical protein
MVTGKDAVYLVTVAAPTEQQAGRNTVYRFDRAGTQPSAQQILPTVGNAALAYAADRVFAAVIGGTGIYELDGDSLALMRTITNERIGGITAANHHLWALSFNRNDLQAYDPDSGQPLTAPLHLPGSGDLLAADGDRVWVSVSVLGGTEIVEVAPS